MASLSVEQIDQKIREHEEQIVELRAVRAAILKFSSNGRKSTPVKSANSRRSARAAPNATGLRAAILALNLPATFSVEDVAEALKIKRFKFAGRAPKEAVRDCLYVLAKKRLGIRLLEQGTGGKQSLYEKVPT